ncbi:MAG: ATP-binding protein, partial [Acidimicrobiales bacterium]
AAEPGQILCSELVRLLARGRGGHGFDSIGFLELKGLPEPLAACSVSWAPAAGLPGLERALPAELAASGRAFVGREAELTAAAEALAGEGLRVCWLLGEPGIGKTRLAAELAARAHADGAMVLFGRCSSELNVPYQPFVEALDAFMQRCPDDRLAGLLGGDAGRLAWLNADLASRLGAQTAPARSASPDVDRYRLFEAVRAWLVAASAEQRLVLVLDDLHWAAAPTLALVRHLAERPEGLAVSFVATARDTTPDANAALGSLVDDLDRRGAVAVRLGGLSAAEVGELAGNAAAAAELHRDTGGNPLFVDAVLRSGPADRPRSVAAAVRQRVARLDDATRASLQTASVMGLEVDLRVLASAVGVAELDALAALETAAAAGLVHELGPHRWRFAHALVQQALREELTATRRGLLHARIADAIEARFAGDLAEWVAPLAYHSREAAAATGDTGRARRWSVAAAERAESVMSFAEAAAAYEAALEHAPADEAARAELLYRLGEARRLAGAPLAALAAQLDAASAARRLGDLPLLARAMICLQDASFFVSEQPPAAVELLALALEGLGDEHAELRCLVRATLARAFALIGDVERCFELSATARRELDELPVRDDATRAAVIWRLTNQGHGQIYRHLDVALLQDLQTAARRCANLDLLAAGINNEIAVHIWLGDLPTGRSRLVELRALAEQTGIALWTLMVEEYDYALALTDGRLEAAEQLAHASAAHLGALAGFDPAFVYGLRMFLVRREQGRLAEAAPLIRTVLRLRPAEVIFRPGLALLYAELGERAAAAAELAALAADDFAALPRDGHWLLQVSMMSEAASASGADGLERRLSAELAPYAEVNILTAGSTVPFGPAARLLGLLAALGGRRAEAEQWFAKALALAERMGAPMWEAKVLADWGRVAERPELLERARALAARHGLTGLARSLGAPRTVD